MLVPAEDRGYIDQGAGGWSVVGGRWVRWWEVVQTMVDATSRVSGRRMSRIVHAMLIFSLLVVIGWRVYGYFATTETETRTVSESLQTHDVRQWREAAGKAFAAEDWNVVVEACEKIVDEEPDNMQAWARLAYALHMLKRYDHAIAAYLRVCHSEGRPRQWALYNISAAYALKNEKLPGARLPPGGGGIRLSATHRRAARSGRS